MEKKNCGDMCGHSCAGGSWGGMCMHGHCEGRFNLVKILLKFIIVALIFMFGFSLGQMTGFIRSEYGQGMMSGINSYGSNWGMMRGYGLNGVTIPVPIK